MAGTVFWEAFARLWTAKKALGAFFSSERVPDAFILAFTESLQNGPEDAFGNELGSMPNAMIHVDAEYGNGGAADGGAADQDRPVPAEVTRPLVTARIEEPRAPARFGIDAGKVRTFVMVVGEASERKVAGDRLAPMLFGDDVIDLKGNFIVDLRHPAILTTVVSALPNQLGKSDVHGNSSAAVGTL